MIYNTPRIGTDAVAIQATRYIWLQSRHDRINPGCCPGRLGPGTNPKHTHYTGHIAPRLIDSRTISSLNRVTGVQNADLSLRSPLSSIDNRAKAVAASTQGKAGKKKKWSKGKVRKQKCLAGIRPVRFSSLAIDCLCLIPHPNRSRTSPTTLSSATSPPMTAS